MATNNSVNSPLSGTTGTGNFAGSLSPSLTNPNMNAIYSAGDLQIAFGSAVSPVNFLQITNGATGSPVSISATGTDTNVALYLSGKGSTQVRLGNDLLMYNPSGGNNYTVFTTTASGAKTVTIPDATGTIQLQQSSPTIQKFTSGSGTYTTPAGVKYIVVQMCGGGGGGGGSSSNASGGTGGTGGNTTFGSSLLTANGGTGGTGANPSVVGAGGSATLNSPAIGISFAGQSGSGGEAQGALAINQSSGAGGNTPFLGGGQSLASSASAIAGQTAVANTGSGGGGSVYVSSLTGSFCGAGGGAGGFIQALITSPSATYSYSVGTAGTAGTAGTSGAAGGAGAAGIIIVTEYYQ